MEICKYDIENYDHNCMKLALPCNYLDHIGDCPILRKENESAKTHATRGREE